MIKRRQLILSIAPAGVFGAGMAKAVALQGSERSERAGSSVIKFGQSAGLSGDQGRYGRDLRDGIQAAFKAARKAGMPPCELLVRDDEHDKNRSQVNIQSLIDSDVVGLIGLTGSLEASLPVIEQAQIPLIGAAGGNMTVRDPKLSMPFHVRAGFDDECKALARYFKEFGVARLAYIQMKGHPLINQKVLNQALEAAGLKLWVSMALNPSIKSYDDEVTQLMQSKLDGILFATHAEPIVNITDQLTFRGYKGLYFSSSLAGQGLLRIKERRSLSIMVSQVVPQPQTASPLSKKYRADLQAFNPALEPGYTSLEGYIAGRVALAAVHDASRTGAVNRHTLKDSLSRLSMDLGGYAVKFGRNDPNGSHWVELMGVGRHGRLLG
jgi:branched-chain amino acid transport system substrate-binding protein